MSALHFNLVATQLDGALLIGDVSIDFTAPLAEAGVDDIPTIATPYWVWLKIDDELVKLTAYTGGTLAGTVLRAQGNTTEQNHNDGAEVQLVAVAEDFGPDVFMVALGDETTTITTGLAKVTFRMPFAMTLDEVRASLTTQSSSGNPTFDINEGVSSILSTKLSIDSGARTSVGATTPAVISDRALADDAEMTIDIDTAGTGAKGAKVTLIGRRVE